MYRKGHFGDDIRVSSLLWSLTPFANDFITTTRKNCLEQQRARCSSMLSPGTKNLNTSHRAGHTFYAWLEYTKWEGTLLTKCLIFSVTCNPKNLTDAPLFIGYSQLDFEDCTPKKVPLSTMFLQWDTKFSAAFSVHCGRFIYPKPPKCQQT